MHACECGALWRLYTHLLALAAASTTSPALRCYSPPPVSSRAAPHFSRFCIGEKEKVRCVCGVSSATGKPLVQCLPCSLWSHVQCARRTAKRSQFSCHVCRAVPSRRKKGFDQTRSLAVRIPRHILPSPPSSALGSTSTVSDPHTHPSISNSHPPPIPPATQSAYASISVQSANPQASPFCLDNPSQCSMSYHSHSPHSPPEGTASSDTISVGNLQPPNLYFAGAQYQYHCLSPTKQSCHRSLYYDLFLP